MQCRHHSWHAAAESGTNRRNCSFPTRFKLLVPAASTRLLVTVLAVTLSATVNGQLYSGPYRPDLIGLYVLPRLATSDTLPRTCREFSAACAAEKAGRYEEAIQMYEEKYPLCGDHGWNITGHAQGSNDFVVFKTTPCGGLTVAIKASRTGKECRVLKELTHGPAWDTCPGCFPRYYFDSNFTHACYSEYVHAGHLTGFSGQSANLHRVKMFFLDGVTNIKALRGHNYEHRDLSFRNMLMRNVTLPSGDVIPKLVFFDFGCAKPLDTLAHLDHHGVNEDHSPAGTGSRRDRRLDGNGIHTDMYMLACDFYSRTYRNRHCGKLELPDDPLTLQYAMVRIMLDNMNHTVEPNYKGIAALVKRVNKF